MEEKEQMTLCTDCAQSLNRRPGRNTGIQTMSLRYCQDGQHRLTPRCPTHGEFLKIAEYGETARCASPICTQRRDAVLYQTDGTPAPNQLKL